MDDFYPEIDEHINPCAGCEDYEASRGCKSNGGCGNPEYITKNEALAIFYDALEFNMKVYTDRIRAIPAADVRPVVYCKDCKHRLKYGICAYSCVCRGDNWFCGYGERRADND